MARVVASITIEAEAVTDAIDLLRSAWEAAASRHGEGFRTFERRLEGLATDDMSAPGIAMMGERAIVAAPAEITALVAEARELGLIR